MYLSHIVPIDYLGKVSLGRFHLVLARWCSNSEDYASFFKKNREQGGFVILDNSYFEKEMVSSEALVRIGMSIRANVLVIPDCEKFEQLGQTTKEFLSVVDKVTEGKPDFDLMGVCHGKTIEEYLEYYQFFAEHPEVGWIGLPARCKCYRDFKWGRESKSSSKNLSFKRAGLLDFLEGREFVEDSKFHHLLGCMDPIELAYSKVFPFVTSCDSSVAYVESKIRKLFGDFGINGERSLERINFLDKFDKEVAKVFEENVKKMNNWAGYIEF